MTEQELYEDPVLNKKPSAVPSVILFLIVLGLAAFGFSWLFRYEGNLWTALGIIAAICFMDMLKR